MSRFRSSARAVAALPLVCAALLSAPSLEAQDVTAGDLLIAHPWSRATAPTAPTGAVYLTIENSGAADRLVSASADVSDTVEIHMSMTDGAGVMQMHPLDGIEIPADGAAVFAPGGTHIMLIGLHAPLKQGGSFPLTLTFEHAGAVTVEVDVRSIGASGPDE